MAGVRMSRGVATTTEHSRMIACPAAARQNEERVKKRKE
jgi:hypothetical protein